MGVVSGSRPLVSTEHDREFRRLRGEALLAQARRAAIWTSLAVVVLAGGLVLVIRDLGALWMTLTGLIVAVLVVGVALLVIWQAASTRASSAMIESWALRNGWAYSPTDSARGPAPEPIESRIDDVMRATEPFPQATPLLRKGVRRSVCDVLAGTVDGVPVRIANHVYEEDSYGAKGERQTTYTRHLVALFDQYTGLDALRLVRRSASGRVLKGADDALAGLGAMRAVELENDTFHQRFSVRVADDADDVTVFAIFSPLVQEHLASGADIPGIDLIEAEAPALLLASKGRLNGDALERLDAMLDAVRWTRARLAPPRSRPR